MKLYKNTLQDVGEAEAEAETGLSAKDSSSRGNHFKD